MAYQGLLASDQENGCHRSCSPESEFITTGGICPVSWEIPLSTYRPV